MLNRLKNHFGSELPVAAGDASRESPLVITQIDNYVALEYMIVKFLLARSKFTLDDQRVFSVGEKVVDEYCFTLHPDGVRRFQERRQFYFDVTAGFDAQVQRH